MSDLNVTEAGKAWQGAVEREHAQSDRLREQSRTGDFWKPVAHRFVPPKRGESAPDDTVERLAEFVDSQSSVLDVGAGGGRIAIPLAEQVSHVTAVEPSESMRDRLVATAKAWGLTNVSVIGETWEATEVEPHDLVVCAHVVYTVRGIEQFIRKLSASARKIVALVSFERPATAMYLPLWKPVHGEDRIQLPSLTEIRLLLGEMGIEFSETPLDEWISRPFKTVEQAQSECETRLFVEPGSEKSSRLSEVLADSLKEVDGGYRLKWAVPHRPRIVYWEV